MYDTRIIICFKDLHDLEITLYLPYYLSKLRKAECEKSSGLTDQILLCSYIMF